MRKSEDVDEQTDKMRKTAYPLLLAKFTHRGDLIRDALIVRFAFRRHQHSGNLRYRAAQFNTRHRLEGWLAPSLHLTKFNCAWLAIPKTHALDTANVGCVAAIHSWKVTILGIRCTEVGSLPAQSAQPARISEQLLDKVGISLRI